MKQSRSIVAVVGRIPQAICSRAEQTLHQYQCGYLRARRLASGAGDVVNVGFRYRLVRKEGKWRLMSHERYNSVARGIRL